MCVCVSVPITGTSGRARTPSTAKRDRPEGQFRRRVKVFARGLALNLRHTGSVLGADSSLGLVEGRASERAARPQWHGSVYSATGLTGAYDERLSAE
jgi:hypothetical protein